LGKGGHVKPVLIKDMANGEPTPRHKVMTGHIKEMPEIGTMRAMKPDCVVKARTKKVHILILRSRVG
jgi:hypothetical protein